MSYDGVAPAGGRRIQKTKDKAQFEPIPPDLDVDKLVRQTDNFYALPRIDATQLLDDNALRHLQEYIEKHVIIGGTPLVIENWHQRRDWPRWIFNPEWLMENHGKQGAREPVTLPADKC